MSEILSKIKPTVIALSLILLTIAIATLSVAHNVTDEILDSEFKEGVAWGTIVTLFVSVISMAVSAISSALTAPDPPGPSVPLEAHIKLMEKSQ